MYWRFRGLYAFSDDREVGRSHLPDRTYNRYVWGLLSDQHVNPFLIPKSRQMNATWEISAYLVWYAMFHPGAEILVVNKKDEDSAYIVSRASNDVARGQGRCRTIYENQPEWIKEAIPANPTDGEIRFSNRAMIKALPEGERQLHQYQASIVYFDECALMDNFAARFYGGALPMSRRTLCSSVPNGYDDWERVVNDRPPSDIMEAA